MKFFLKKNGFYILLCLIVLIQVGFMTWNFTRKENFHSDELWSYGFAASSNGAHIYMDDEQIEYKNLNEWVSTEVLKDYVVVDEHEVFDYKSVYENCAVDIHPPIYFFVLHFILALFKGTWSKWYAFAINLFAFVLIQIFLFRLIYRISKDRVFALICTTYFGFTMGAINITIYLRNYALGTALFLMFLFYTVKIYYDQEKDFWKNNIKAGICLFLAVLTVHLNLFFAFVVTALFCLCFMLKKQFTVMIRYGYVMLISALLSIAVFPATIPHLFVSGELSERTKYPPDLQFKIYWAYLHRDITGLRNSIWPQMTMTYINLTLMGIVALAVPTVFLFRKEKWFRGFLAKMKNKLFSLWKNRSNFPFPILLLFLAVFALLWVDANITNIFIMQQYSRRYMFVAYPVFWCYLTTLFYYPLKVLAQRKIFRYELCMIVLAFCMCDVYVERVRSFYFPYDSLKEGVQFEDLEEDANIIITIKEPFVLVCAIDQLMDKGNFYMARHRTLLEKEDTFYDSSKINEHPLYVAINLSGLQRNKKNGDKTANDDPEEETIEGGNSGSESKADLEIEPLPKYEDEIDKIEELLYNAKLEKVGLDVLYGRKFEIYKVIE